ncbi:YheC/YheD family endospore coat-associated protein [Dethiobacter alkaliphilus]|nr:YheC/YheD family protein [Dethiobacter alkaliphilus]
MGVIFFSYDDIDFERMEVNGYSLLGGLWEKKTLSMPSVIYDQAHSCPAKIRRKLMEIPTLRFVNEKIGFWKWETHQALDRFSEIRDFLPETSFFEESDQIYSLLKKYGKAVLKPVHGLKAMGLIILVNDNGKIRFQYRGKGKDRMNYKFGRVEELHDLRTQFPVMGTEKYIVQQGLELAKYEDRVFDVRALMQKDGSNMWHASLCAKVGPSNSEITALGNWENIERVESFLISKCGSKFNNLSARLKQLAVLTAETVEKAFAPVGEIALDIAVDKNADCWLLEVNSMPSKAMFYDLFNDEELSDVLSRPMEYACYLAKESLMQKCRVCYLESDLQQTLFLTPKQSKEFNLDHEKAYVRLTVGSASLLLRKEISKNNSLGENKLTLSRDLKTTVFIPEDTELQVRVIEPGHLELGPLIGVFISPKKAAALVGGKTDRVYYQFTNKTKSVAGICCFFSIGDIDWENKLIRALLWDGSTWISRIVPLPKVIYDRCFGERSYGFELRNKLDSDYRVINSLPKLGKWETIQALKNTPGVKKYLPDTIVYSSKSDIADFLEKYQSIYLKPDMLYKGKGIYRLKRGPGASYIVEFRDDDTNEIIHLPTLDDLDEMLGKYLEIGWGYIVQETIELSYYKVYPFDFRLLYQKDWQGSWQPTYIVARIAAPGSVVTSPRSGGAVADFNTVLDELNNQECINSTDMYQEIITAGRKIVESIEDKFGDFVELGLDMAIDKSGKLWLIEVNGKPLKVSIKKLNNAEAFERCHNSPIEYAIYLSGFIAKDTRKPEEQLI